jgi:hypothetical protein
VVRSAGAIQGILLQRISVTEPNGLSMEILVAPSLACHMMEVHTFRNGLLLKAQTTDNLQIGDPDPLLFEIPADYRVTEAAH